MTEDKKKKEGFWRRQFRRYEVSLLRQGDQAVVRSFVANRFFAAITVILFVVIIVAATTLVLFYTPLQSFMPGYVSPTERQQIVDIALKIDSLTEVVDRQKLYVTNLQDILRGEVKMDTVSSIDSLTASRSELLIERTEREKEFSRHYEEVEKYNLTSQASRLTELEGLNLFTPIRGSVERDFDPLQHHNGVDVSAVPSKNVLSVLDGCVLVSSYTANNGYVVAVQHSGDLVSVYKHLGALLLHEGDKVKAGQPL